MRVIVMAVESVAVDFDLDFKRCSRGWWNGRKERVGGIFQRSKSRGGRRYLPERFFKVIGYMM